MDGVDKGVRWQAGDVQTGDRGLQKLGRERKRRGNGVRGGSFWGDIHVGSVGKMVNHGLEHRRAEEKTVGLPQFS